MSELSAQRNINNTLSFNAFVQTVTKHASYGDFNHTIFFKYTVP